MRRKLLAVVACAVLQPALAFCEGKASPTSDRVYRTECFFTFPAMIDGRTFSLQASREEIDQSPAWGLISGEEPPVSVDQATRLAIEEFRSHFKNADDWALQNLALRPMCEGRWVYVLTWQPKERDVPGMVSVPVLMSGKVVSLQGLTWDRTQKQ